MQEQWVVDPELDAVTVHRRDETGFARISVLSAGGGDALETPLLPAWSVRLAELFASPQYP